MRRVLYGIPIVAVVALAVFFLLKPASAPAEAETRKSTDPLGVQSPLSQLPIHRVILFSSGVGYFQREGQVEGTTRIDLSFPVQDINDLLKSLVLQDLEGGQVSAVSYDSHDPIDKTLQGFAINLTNNPPFAQILAQARGERVEVVVQQAGANQPGTLNGAILGTERQRQAAGKEPPVEVEFLNLWCADGMRSVRLADVQRIHFLNPTMENEFKRALNVLAMGHDNQKKAVSLSFTGDGKRKVRVTYVVEHPIWKTSYRLVLAKKEQPFLQGWAVVENPTDEDWSNVNMVLVSGRPISFQMNLYQPLYVPRPTVEPELFASLRPQAYGTGLAGFAGGAGGGAPVAPGTAMVLGGVSANSTTSPASPTLPSDPQGNVKLSPQGRDRAFRRDRELQEGLNLTKGIASSASAMQLGDFFQYAIEHPVSLPRRKSALLPIVNQNIECTRVSIYSESTHAKFPLLGVKLRNTTGLHLMQGPITVFEGNSYAGDARILDLQPKEERLLSYAIDLGTEVEPVVKEAPARLTAVKVQKGVLFSTTKVRESKTYNVKNRSDQDRTLIIEHPYRQAFRLVSQEKPAERTREVYRFEVKLPQGETVSREIIEEQDLVREVVLTNADDQTMRLFLSSPVSSPGVKKALDQARTLKNRLATTQGETAQLERQLKTITEDQSRLRANLKEMPPTAAAYKRYLNKFDSQETEIENLQTQIKKLQEAEHSERKEYESFLANLNVE
jgi:hypothetical protein